MRLRLGLLDPAAEDEIDAFVEALTHDAPDGQSAHVFPVRLRAYSEDQPRDDSGRWSSDGGGGGGSDTTGRLDAESEDVQSAAGRLRGDAERIEPRVTADMHDLESVSGGELVGLDARLKSQGSLARKLATDPDYVAGGLTLGEREAKIKDSIRYTIQLDEDRYEEGARAALDEARGKGYTVTTKNAWKERSSGYAGFHASLSKEGEPTIELQFHTATTFRAKEFGFPDRGLPASHVLYEELRVETDPVKASAIQAKVDALWGPIRAGAPRGALNL